MPTADTFTALGRGNGFPFCLETTDVTDYDYWTTLSGVNKDNVEGFSPSEIDAKIQESLRLAMKLYWNTNQLLASYSYFTSTVTNSLEADSLSPPSTPQSRICPVTFYFPNLEKPTFIQCDLNIYRYEYEGNFVGFNVRPMYGLSARFTPLYAGRGYSVSGAANIWAFGALENLIDATNSRTIESSYETIESDGDTFHFFAVGLSWDYDSGSGNKLESEFDLENFSVKCIVTNQGQNAGTNIAKIDGFDFYTY